LRATGVSASFERGTASPSFSGSPEPGLAAAGGVVGGDFEGVTVGGVAFAGGAVGADFADAVVGADLAGVVPWARAKSTNPRAKPKPSVTAKLAVARCTQLRDGEPRSAISRLG
jgi:hypothetical protein